MKALGRTVLVSISFNRHYLFPSISLTDNLVDIENPRPEQHKAADLETSSIENNHLMQLTYLLITSIAISLKFHNVHDAFHHFRVTHTMPRHKRYEIGPRWKKGSSSVRSA